MGGTEGSLDSRGALASALLQAAEAGLEDVVAQLLEARAPIDVVDDTGWTPLHMACFGGYDRIVAVSWRPALSSAPDADAGTEKCLAAWLAATMRPCIYCSTPAMAKGDERCWAAAAAAVIAPPFVASPLQRRVPQECECVRHGAQKTP